MTPLDIAQIIFLAIVVIIGIGGLIKVAIFSNDKE